MQPRWPASWRQGTLSTVSGELGTGKTTFIRGACRALGVTAPVASPTFTIGHRYLSPAGRPDVSHLDLYRFEAWSDVDWGDLEPYFEDAIVFVEWPEALHRRLPAPRARVWLRHLGGDRRLMSLDGGESLEIGLARGARAGVRHGHRGGDGRARPRGRGARRADDHGGAAPASRRRHCSPRARLASERARRDRRRSGAGALHEPAHGPRHGASARASPSMYRSPGYRRSTRWQPELPGALPVIDARRSEVFVLDGEPRCRAS